MPHDAVEPLHASELREEAPVVHESRRSPYSRVIDMVEETCIDPEVAVMVMVDVTGLVVELLEVPPQAEIRPNPVKRTASIRNRCSRLRFLKPRKQSAAARVAGKRGMEFRWIIAVVEAGVTVSVVVVVPPSATLIGLGLKEQL